jgi:trimethylamine--corrinoid protein Co-methyltransferase
MIDRMQVFTADELSLIHDASMDILMEAGVKFNAAEALEIFRQHGFNTDGSRVFITEKDVGRALETVPSRFMISARNPAHNVFIGEDDFVFLPTGGAPNVVNSAGKRRPATLADYRVSCKLVQTSDQLDMNGWLMVQPTDIPPQVAHLDMLLADITMCDKAYVGTATSRLAARDCLDMAAVVWSGKENLKQRHAMATIVTVTSPLKYTVEEAESIIDMAHLRQPLVITNLVMAGTSGPVSLPGLLALANAEILAGLVLAQLAGPGTPVVYGSISAPADMRTVISAVGAPEAVVLASAATQLARFYRLPCRTGGMLTNAHCPDAQAAAEGTLMMSTAVRNGANFIFHACGQLGSYISMSFEKWLIDEEVCRMLRRTLAAMDITVESIDVDTIKSVGSDGNYLVHPTTFKHCRSLYRPNLFTRDDYQSWWDCGAKNVSEVAYELLPKRLAEYIKPPIDEGLEQALIEFVSRRKKQFFENTPNTPAFKLKN